MTWLRRLAASAIVALVAVAPMARAAEGASGSVPITAQPSTPRAVLSFQGCVSGTTTPADVLILVDETASLPSTDPTNQRALGLKAALRAMAETTQLSANDKFNVQIAGFGRGVTRILGHWTPVTGGALHQLYGDADRASQVAQGQQGLFTNFAAALSFADQTLAATPAGSCRALLWFTDGILDVTNDGTYDNVPDRQAMASICRQNGIADNLVQDHVSSFAIGLTNDTLEVSLPGGVHRTVGALGRESLQSIVSGGSNYLTGGGPCGTITSAATGTFFDAPQQTDLIFQMQQLVCSGSKCVVQTQHACVIGALSCPADAEIPFWVGPGIASFTLDGVAQSKPSEPLEVQIRDQASRQAVTLRVINGKEQCFPTACSLGGVRLAAAQSLPGVAEVRVVGTVSSSTFRLLRATYLVPSGAGATVRQIFYETSSVRLTVSVTGQGSGPCPNPPGPGLVAYVGCSFTGEVQAVRATGIFPSALQANLTGLTLSLNGHDVTMALRASSKWPAVATFSLHVPQGTSLGREVLQANGVLNLGVGAAHYAAIALSTTPSIQIEAPPSYPSIVSQSTPPVVQVGQRFSVDLRVDPAATGNGGSVCLDASKSISVGGPAGLHVAGLTSTVPVVGGSGQCSTPLGSETATYRVAGTLQQGDDGRFTVAVPVLLGSSSANQAQIQTNVVLVLRSNVPVNVARSILLLLLLLLLGFLGVVGVAFGVNAATAKFPRLVNIRTMDVRYDVASRQLTGVDGKPVDLAPFTTKDLANQSGQGERTITKAGLTFRASAGRGPKAWLLGLFTGPRAYVSAGGSPLLVGPSGRAKPMISAPIPMNLHKVWVFRVTGSDVADRSGDQFMVDESSGVRSVSGTLSVLMLTGATGGDGSAGLSEAVQGATQAISANVDTLTALNTTIPSSVAPSASNSAPTAGPSVSIDDINI